MLRLFLLFVLVATLAAAQTGPDLPAQLTLSQALNIALSNSTNIREALARLDQASGRYQQSRSVLLPQLDVSARQNFQTVNLIGIGIDLASAQGLIGPFGSMDARMSLSQDLFNLANVRAWQSYRSRQDSSRLLADNAREIVVLNVISTLYQKAPSEK
jgi:outer membrane protein TolC